MAVDARTEEFQHLADLGAVKIYAQIYLQALAE